MEKLLRAITLLRSSDLAIFPNTLIQKAKFDLNNINNDNVNLNKNNAVRNYKVSVYFDDKYFVKISVNSNSCSCEVKNREMQRLLISVLHYSLISIFITKQK